MSSFLCQATALAALAFVIPFSTAQAQSSPDPQISLQAPLNAEQAENLPQPSLKADVGVGTFVAPAFLGSKDYQLNAIPMISIRYKDRVFFSVVQGLGFELVKTSHLSLGPVLHFMPDRKEDDKEIFKIIGDRSNALRGLGNVSSSAEFGGFFQYTLGNLSARVEVLKATAASKGVTAELGLKYNKLIPTTFGRPIILSFGPRTTIVDDKYNTTYYGVTALQSERSGLPIYTAKGGLLSAGVGAAAIVPISRSINGFLFTGYDRMADDAARSPLVEQRGSRNQGTLGLGITYHFTAF